MKRLGNLYNKILDKDNLELAIHNACKRKSSYASVKIIKDDMTNHINKVHRILEEGTYKVAPYKQKKIYEPKERLISILPLFPDRVIQHAIMNVLEDYWDSIMIHDSYACRKGKGQHQGSIKCMKHCRNYKYVLKCDISKFYPSLDHSILKETLERKIKDYKLLELLGSIIDSYGDGKGIPIGSYLSQWLGNLYMTSLDMYIKHELKCKAYIRYCDDFVIFSNSKEEIKNVQSKIKKYCGDVLNLKMSKCEYFPSTQGVDFLGYRHFPDGKILLRKRTAKRFSKKIQELEGLLKRNAIDLESARSKVASMSGWLKHANTYNFTKKLKLNKLKGKIDERLSKNIKYKK